MFFYLLSLIVISTISVPFLDPNTVHVARSELEVNLIINENRNYFILVGTVEDSSEKKLEKLEDYFKSTLEEEKGISIGIAIDCSNFQNNLNGTIGICRNPNTLFVLTPSGKILNLFDHYVMSGHQRLPIIGQTSQGILTKKIRDQIPDLIKQVEDEYDLQQFLDYKTTKIIYFEQNLLKPPFLKKLALVFYRRIDFAVCDNKEIMNKYGSGLGKMVILNYDYLAESYIEQRYKGDTNFQNNPFSEIQSYLNKFVFPTRSRDILLDFQINQQTPLNISSRLMLNKLMNMDKIVIVQKSNQLECPQLVKLMQKYEFLFSYACYNGDDKDIQEGKLYYSEIRSHKIHELTGKVEDVIKFSQISNLVSSEIQMDKCLKTGQMIDKLIVISYLSDPHINYLLRFVNAHPAFSTIFHFCKVYVPDRFTFRKVEVDPQTLVVLVKRQGSHPSGGDAYQKIQHKNLTNYYALKMFLREVSIRKILPVMQKIGSNITQIHTPQQLTENCFSKSCIIGLIKPKKSRSKAEIALLTTLSQQFKAFNFVWINADCHHEIGKQLKIISENSELLYFNQKKNKYLQFGRKYWIKSEVRKWLKVFLMQDAKLRNLKLSLTIEPKKCQKNIYLDQL